MAANAINPLLPTYQGYVNSTFDALLLFEACLTGRLTHVPRRPHDRERQDLIQSGNVFIYEEHASGIKRWTDGISWSPSRILGNFLIYRELDEPFPPGEKKRALKKSKHLSGGINRPDTITRTVISLPPVGVPVPASEQETLSKILVGSLVDSYNFKANGLIKKTISVTVNGVPHHLVSYYSVDDVLKNRLPRPSQDRFFRPCTPRHELLHKQNFRASLEEFNSIDGYPWHHDLIGPPGGSQNHHQSMQYMHPYGHNMQGMAQQSMNSPQSPSLYNPQSAGYSLHGMPAQQTMSPQQAISAHQQMASNQHMQHQMTWAYPANSQAPMSGFFATETQMPLTNGYFDQEADSGDDVKAEQMDQIKAEQLDQEAWAIGQSDQQAWPMTTSGHSSVSLPGQTGQAAWNGTAGSAQ